MADKRFVVADGKRKAACDWPMETIVDGPHGAKFAAIVAVSIAKEYEADRLFIFEDDIALTKNAVARMLALEIPDDVAFVSFYDGGDRAGIKTKRDVFERGDPKLFSGSLAIALPRRMIDFLAVPARPSKRPAYDASYIPNNAWDAALGFSAAASPWPLYGRHQPSLVQHVGISSVVSPDAPERVSITFPGESFNAMTLGGVKRPSSGRSDDPWVVLNLIAELAEKTNERIGFLLARSFTPHELASLDDEDLIKNLASRLK